VDGGGWAGPGAKLLVSSVANYLSNAASTKLLSALRASHPLRPGRCKEAIALRAAASVCCHVPSRPDTCKQVAVRVQHFDHQTDDATYCRQP